jgi:hypothetical protein
VNPAAGSPPAPLAVQANRTAAVKSSSAAQEAITPEHVAALMRVAPRHGLQGNLAAIRLLLDRARGRVPDGTPDSVQHVTRSGHSRDHAPGNDAGRRGLSACPPCDSNW